jgi:hypothetical protein
VFVAAGFGQANAQDVAAGEKGSGSPQGKRARSVPTSRECTLFVWKRLPTYEFADGHFDHFFKCALKFKLISIAVS